MLPRLSFRLTSLTATKPLNSLVRLLVSRMYSALMSPGGISLARARTDQTPRALARPSSETPNSTGERRAAGAYVSGTKGSGTSGTPQRAPDCSGNEPGGGGRPLNRRSPARRDSIGARLRLPGRRSLSDPHQAAALELSDPALDFGEALGLCEKGL